MLQQCFHVLGERKLRKMLPDELKDSCLEDIKKMCWEQLESISEQNLLQILTGKFSTQLCHENEITKGNINIIDCENAYSVTCKQSTKCLHIFVTEVGVSSEESDVLSINADTYDSDIEPVLEAPIVPLPKEPKKDIQSDIDKSVSEILSFSASGPTPPSVDQTQATGAAQSVPATGVVCQPSIQQLELLELEMRARAIKALMKASKKTTD
uniref:Caspase activity and apoptosis inhibitor 1 n=1 Tax=Neogobius melanostomus TaxID=47308 RepID=A0A8C6UBR5_9GOBI